ncbi:hypothetical protein ACX80O_11205 [Arthrobacter sp. Hz1]
MQNAAPTGGDEGPAVRSANGRFDNPQCLHKPTVQVIAGQQRTAGTARSDGTIDSEMSPGWVEGVLWALL